MVDKSFAMRKDKAVYKNKKKINYLAVVGILFAFLIFIFQRMELVEGTASFFCLDVGCVDI